MHHKQQLHYYKFKRKMSLNDKLLVNTDNDEVRNTHTGANIADFSDRKHGNPILSTNRNRKSLSSDQHNNVDFNEEPFLSYHRETAQRSWRSTECVLFPG